MKYSFLLLILFISTAFANEVEQRRGQILKIIDEEISEVRRLTRQSKKDPNLLLRLAELNLEKARLWREKENQDFLYIPPLRKVISVIGYVQFPTSHIFEANKSINDYIALSGGAKKQADTDRVYVIRANGSVFVPNQSFWFSREDKPLMPGDTIVMPMDTDYMDKLTTFTSATQILYQLGVAWSAISN